jgi:hypothetical protein
LTNGAPPQVEEAARQRSEARAERDWATADRLRAEIEIAGWRVVDSGTAYRLEPASPPDVDVGGEIRYGRTDAVPSRLDDPPTGLASVIVVASPDPLETRRALDALAASAREGIDVVVVSDGLPDRALEGLPRAELPGLAGTIPLELVRTSAVLGQAAALNIGIRRSRAPIVVVLDPSITPTGDVVTPFIEALEDPTVAIAGQFGLRSADLRRFEEVLAPAGGSRTSEAVDAAAIQGYLMAFRRSDAAARGPLDEGFRFFRNLDIWWSLVLRDEGEGRSPRRALVVPGLELERAEPRAWSAAKPAERERLSKRNFYRILDRFRTRLDLAVP